MQLVARIAISVALLLPVVWHSRIQAGDLGSHIYNAWLAQLVEQGQAPGLTIVPIYTNVLFDWMLKVLLPLGPDVAQRVSVGAIVLLFFWSAFAFVCKAGGHRPLFLMPVLAVVSYGWTFHMGLHNFYLSCGLTLFAITIAWRGEWGRIALAAPLLGVALLAHVLPVAWGVAILSYVFVARRLSPAATRILLASCIAAVVALRLVLDALYTTHWTNLQLFGVFAADQTWVFGYKFYVLSILFAILWSFLALRLEKVNGFRYFLDAIPFHLALLTMVGVVVLPTAIETSSVAIPLTLISERMTLLMSVVLCLAFSKAKPLQWQKGLLASLAAVFFVFVYVDTGAVNRIETRMQDLVDKLPRGSRVVTSLYDPGVRTFILEHNIDRVCVGKCFSYANYEPSSNAFRVRVTEANPMVMFSAKDAGKVGIGAYVVQPQDEPLYQVKVCGARIEHDLCVVQLKAGEKVEHQDIIWVTPKFLW
jgi:hypothetical protein